MVELSFEYFENKWLSIPLPFRILILFFNLLAFILLLLYIYFFKNSLFRKLIFCSRLKCRLCRKGSKTERKEEYEIQFKSSYLENDEDAISNLEKDSKQLDSNISDVYEKESELPKYTQSKSRIEKTMKNDKLIDNIRKYKNSLKTSMKLATINNFIKTKNEATGQEFSVYFEDKSDTKDSVDLNEPFYKLIKVENQSSRTFGPKKIELNKTTKTNQHSQLVGSLFSNTSKDPNKRSDYGFSHF